MTVIYGKGRGVDHGRKMEREDGTWKKGTCCRNFLRTLRVIVIMPALTSKQFNLTNLFNFNYQQN